MDESNVSRSAEIVHIPESGFGVECRIVPGFPAYAIDTKLRVWSRWSMKKSRTGRGNGFSKGWRLLVDNPSEPTKRPQLVLCRLDSGGSCRRSWMPVRRVAELAFGESLIDICLKRIEDTLGGVECRLVSEFPHYAVSADGEVFSQGRAIIVGHWSRVIPQVHDNGRLYVDLYNGDTRTRRRYFVHRLVLEVFVGACPEGKMCCHKNDVPTDNRVSNLYWGTHKENIRDAFRNNRIKMGTDHHNGRITDDQVVEIRGEYLKLKEKHSKIPNGSLSKIAEKHGIKPCTVYAIGTGRCRKSV